MADAALPSQHEQKTIFLNLRQSCSVLGVNCNDMELLELIRQRERTKAIEQIITDIWKIYEFVK